VYISALTHVSQIVQRLDHLIDGTILLGIPFVVVVVVVLLLDDAVTVRLSIDIIQASRLADNTF